MRDLADSNFSETVRSDPLLLPPAVDEHLPGGFLFQKNLMLTMVKMVNTFQVGFVPIELDVEDCRLQ